VTPLIRSRVGSGTQAGVVTITIDSPHNRNALSVRLLSELLDAVRAAVGDPAVRVIVLTHSDPAFCSGADLTEAGDRSSAGALPASMPALLEALWHSPKPTVVRVAGPVRAGGLGLLGACDLVVCSADATFAFTEVRLGLVPAVISATVLPKLLRSAAHELLLTGETFGGRRAVQIGLATAAVAPAELDAEVRRYVGMLLRGGPGALSATKGLLRRRPSFGLDDLPELSELSARHFTGDEGQEGIAAFTAKRSPSWLRPR